MSLADAATIAALKHYACSCEPGICAMSDDGGDEPVDATLCGRIARDTLAAINPALAAPHPTKDEGSSTSGWYVEHNLANCEGFGASFIRDDWKWHLYTMPGAKPFGTISGYDKASIDFVIDALRRHLSAHPSAALQEGLRYAVGLLPGLAGAGNQPDNAVYTVMATKGEILKAREYLAAACPQHAEASK